MENYADWDAANPLVVIGWEEQGATILRPFRVDMELLDQEYGGDLVAYVQEVHTPSLEWYFELQPRRE